MPIYHALGDLPKKRHVAHRRPDGAGVYHEQLMGNKGFTGPSSLLYHLRPPTRVRDARPIGRVALEADPEARLAPRHFRSERLPVGGSPTLDRVPLLFNGDCVISFAHADRQDEHFYRNAAADELFCRVAPRVLACCGDGLCEGQETIGDAWAVDCIPAPEPGALAMLAAGVGWLAVLRARRRAAS